MDDFAKSSNRRWKSGSWNRDSAIANFMVNLMAGIIAYCLSPNKPRIPASVAQALQMQNQARLIQN